MKLKSPPTLNYDMKTILCLITLTISLSANAITPITSKKLGISQLFSDHMVLQQKTKVNIWGWSQAGQTVIVAASWGKKATSVANADGKWKVKLITPAAGGPYTIVIKTKVSEINIKDVLIGEVWLASGQSNMDIPLKGWPPGDTIFNSAHEISIANYPVIRFMKVPFGISATPQDSTGGK